MTPSSTRAFSSTISSPLMWRRVLRARSKPRSVASCQLFGEAAVIVETDATAISRSPVKHRLGRHVEGEAQPHLVLEDAALLHDGALLHHRIPVMPRKVRFARATTSRAASSKESGEEPISSLTLATHTRAA